MDDKQFSDGSVRMIDLVPGGQGRLTLDYRLLHPFPFVQAVRCAITHTMKAREVQKVVVPLKETHQNPWVHRLQHPLKHVSGELKLRLSIGDVPRFEETLSLGNAPSQQKTVVLKQPAQRLVKTLTETPQGAPVFNAQSTEEQVRVQLKWIADRLERGLLETAWLGPDGGRGLDLDELRLTAEARADELWARQIAEMLVSLPYALPGTFYQKSETALYRAMSQRIQAGRPAFYPLTIQCQQSCSMALLSRGVPFELITPGCNAGNTEGLRIFKQPGAKWHKGNQFLTAKDALTASPPAAPGTLFEFFSKEKGPNKGGAHIGFILRTHDAGWFGLQTFDTGGLNAPGRSPVPLMQTSGGLGGGIFCDPWTDKIRGSGEPFSGMGVIPATFRPVANLGSWFPLGFARLVLTRRADNIRLYATPLLWMHHKAESFSQARLAWALRALPFADRIEAVWQVWIPRGAFMEAAVEAERSTPLRSLLGATGKAVDKPLSDVSREILNTVNIVCSENGTVNVVKKLALDTNKPDTLPWGVRSRDAKAPDLPALSSVPEYLRGEET